MKDANIDRRKERVIRRMVIEAELFDLVDEIREANRMTKGAVDALSFVLDDILQDGVQGYSEDGEDIRS